MRKDESMLVVFIDDKVKYWLNTIKENKKDAWDVIRLDLFNTDTKGTYPWYFFINQIENYCTQNKGYEDEYKTAKSKYQRDFKITGDF